MIDECTERLQLRVPKSFLKMIDNWRRRQEDLPNRSEAIRRLVEMAIVLEKERR